MKSTELTYWLVLIVFLLFEQTATVALTVSPIQVHRFQNTDRADGHKGCQDWEEFDGVECVCARNNSVCNDIGGVVCDNQGIQYISPCSYSLQMCQQNISIHNDIVTCGACDVLMLTGGKQYPKGSTLAKFIRQGPESGLATKYKCLNDNETEIFFSAELNTWVIGKLVKNVTFVSMVQPAFASYPEEGGPGMYIPKKTNLTWDLDETLRLECVKDNTSGKREKRFIFMIFAAISVVTAVTTTTLHVVQATKGCLYYPSVCTMRDEIKNQLLPSLKKDRDRFVSLYGNPKDFEDVVNKIHDKVLEIKGRITEIPELHSNLNRSFTELVKHYSSLTTDFPEINNILSDYDKWLSGVLGAAKRDINMLPLDILMSMPGLVAESASSLALAMSGIGAVLSFAFGIVDVVSSVLEEKNTRDQLQRNKNILADARVKIDKAFRDMKSFQTKFCLYIVKFLDDLAFNGKLYEGTFKSLYSFISLHYGHSSDRCNIATKIEQTDLRNLQDLQLNYITPIVNKLSTNVESLKRNISETKETMAFLDAIKTNVKQQHMEPAEIFRLIKTTRPVPANKMFLYLFDLLQLISKSILPQESCYWGHNLDAIRRGVITERNYMTAPLCKSVDMASQSNIIANSVRQLKTICGIHRLVSGTVFRNNFQIVRFIADFILPTEHCYWGYNLDDIRGHPDITELTNAKVDSLLIGTIRNVEPIGQVQLAREMIGGKFKIYSAQWQDFLLCHVWKTPSILHTLNCGRFNLSSTCIPQNFQSC